MRIHFKLSSYPIVNQKDSNIVTHMPITKHIDILKESQITGH